jgi:hypothetical protein
MTLGSVDVEMFFFRRTGATLFFNLFTAMSGAKVKHLRRGGKQISLGTGAKVKKLWVQIQELGCG